MRQVSLVVIAALLGAATVVAQPIERAVAPGVTEIIDGGSVKMVYDRAYFASYSPISAKDIIERVPGVTSLAGAVGVRNNEKSARRGLRSSTDQVLINGRRVSGKEGTPSDLLEKLPAQRIVRIEVITGEIKELDAEVGARVINIVTDQSSTIGGSYTNGIINTTMGDTIPVFLVNISGESGGLSYNFSVEKRPQASPGRIVDRRFSPAGVLIGGVDETRDRSGRLLTSRLLIGYNFESGTTLQFNGIGSFVPSEYPDIARAFTIAGTTRTPTTAILDRTDNKDYKAEGSVDLTVPFGSGHKFLALGVYNRRTIDEDSLTSNLVGATTVAFAADTRDEHAAEGILRGTFQFSVFNGDTIELGAEGARNKLDKDLDFFTLTPGVRTEVPLFNSDQVNTEDRIEPFLSYTWQPFDSLVIEPGIAAEFSWLDQIGPDVDEERHFKFVKPSFNFYWTLSPREQIYINVIRDVAQLSFTDFAATVDRDGDEILGGNPLLRPERSWDFALGTSVTLPGDRGNFGLRGFYRTIDDVLDRVPIVGTASGPGNIGSGKSYGGKVEMSVKLGKFGLFDGTLSSNYTWQDSRVTDPFTRLKRRIAKQPRYIWGNQFRHDVRSWGFSYGLEYTKNGGFIESDFDKFDRRTTAADARVFFEQQFTRNVSARFFYTNVARESSVRMRTRYAVSQADGTVLQTERRAERPAAYYGVRVRGTF